LTFNLATYEAWLRRRGAGDDTIYQYVFHAARTVGGEDPFERITDRSLSPKYRRVCKAAIVSFAKFNKDDDLIEQIREVKLPSPVRKKVKVPLDGETWHALRDEIDEADYITEPMRAELGIMANRGIRRGDVLRLKKTEVTAALKTKTLSYLAKGERRLEFGLMPSWERYLELLKESFAHTRGAEVVADLIAPKATEDGRKKIAGAAVVRALRRVASRIDLPDHDVEEIHPHLLRATVAQHFFEACGRDPIKLKEYMQWASIEVAMGYVSAGSRESLDAIAETMFK
jgi:integrase